jgi:peptidoglycan hydrolase-like protein with peptidoglycan-binding domain
MLTKIGRTGMSALLAGLLIVTGAVLAGPAQAAPSPIALTSARCPANMAHGERDGCVTELQKLLNKHGAHLTVDGDFGPKTLTAVKGYQRKHGLSVDGIVGPNTKDSLYASKSAPAAIALTSSRCPTDIQEGEVDGCVTELQKLLDKHGASLKVDGDFGASTLAAVEKYQRNHGLAADGVVGPNTKASLTQAKASAPAPISLTSTRCPTDIQKGQKSGCVTELQTLLNKHGAGLRVDGDFGAATLAAVKSYQNAHGLSADGIVGPQTKASLTGTHVKSPPPPPPPKGSVLSKIVSYARDVEHGDAEKPAWNGGNIQYVWGGGHHSSPGPSTGTCVGDPQSLSCTDPAAVGLDCSGFARWIYSLAYGRDVLGAGGTSQQIDETSKTSSPKPGDLVFFNNSKGKLDHVGIYIGSGKMINSYDTGTVVQTNSLSAGGTLVGYYQY